MQWKGWQRGFTYGTRQAECFSGEFKNYNLKGLRILEIGFGDGAFLAGTRALGPHIVLRIGLSGSQSLQETHSVICQKGPWKAMRG